MNDIIKFSALDTANIDLKNYSTSLTLEAYRTGIISENDFDLLKSKSMEALAEVIGYYTKNESTSIKTDTAKELAKSLIYNVDTAKFNTLPSRSGKYRFINILYELDKKRMRIVEYDIYYTK